MPFPLLAAAAPAIGSAIGGIASGLGSFFGQKSANEANASSARDAMRFSERMSDTQWQRGVADMKKAGINPMLAFSQGGASSPSGVTSTSQNPVPNLSEIVSSAFDVMKTVADTAKTQADTQRTFVETKKAAASLPEAVTKSNFWSAANQVVNRVRSTPRWNGNIFPDFVVKAANSAKAYARSHR